MKNGLTDDELNVISDTCKKMEDLGLIPKIVGENILTTDGINGLIFNTRDLTPLEQETLIETYKQSLRKKPLRPNRK